MAKVKPEKMETENNFTNTLANTLANALGKTHYCKVGKNRIAYHRKGKGPTVVFVHGITTYSFIWKQVIPLLKGFDTIAIDLFGCGDSDKPLDEEYSLKQHAENLHEFVKKLKITKFHLVCHDVGGGIGQIFAVNYAKLLKKLVLMNTVGYDFWPVQPIIMMRTPILRQLAMASLDTGALKIIIKRALFHKDKLTPALMEFFKKPLSTKNGRKAFLHFAKCLNNKNLLDIADKLPLLKTPVLILRGNNDVYLSEEIAEKLHQNIPKSKLIKMEKCGHFMQEDEPELIASHLAKFLKGS